MKRSIFMVMLMLLCMGRAWANTPIFAENHVSASSTLGYGVSRYDFPLPNATMSGNCVVVGFQYSARDGNITATVSDDRGNTYSPLISNNDGTQIVNLSYALNVLPGTQKISITFSGGAPSYVSALATEFYNIATSNALDGFSGNAGTGTSVTASSFTPSTSGDLIYQYAVQDSTSNPMNSWSQGGSPWTLLSSDVLNGSAAQYQVQASAAPINPTLGMAPSQNFNSVAIALKAADAGSAPPSGIRVVRVQHHSVSDANSTTQLQFPCTGNLIVVAWIGAPGHDITEVTDGNLNAYESQGSAYGYHLSGDSQIYFAANAVTNTTMTGPTITANNTDSSGSTAVLFDVRGAAASPYDLTAEASGYQPNAGNVTGVTISPSMANGLVITTIGVDSNTINGLAAGSPGNFLSAVPTPMTPDNPVDQNNGWALWYNPSAAAGTFIWSTEGGQVDDWASIAVAFKAVSGTGPSPSFSGNVTPSSATVSVGNEQIFNVQVSSVNNFQGTVDLSCPNPPAGINCRFSSSSVQVSPSSVGTSQLTIQVTSKPTANIAHQVRSRPRFFFAFTNLQACAGFLAISLLLILHRNGSRGKLRVPLVIGTAVTLWTVLALGLTSCGGGGSSKPTPPGGGGSPVTVQVSIQGTSGSITVNLGTVSITVP
jgi:hypothetical protein